MVGVSSYREAAKHTGSYINRFDIIRPEARATCRALTMPAFNCPSHALVTEQVIALGNNNLMATRNSVVC